MFWRTDNVTLQSSGTISIANIRGEFGGSIPDNINEYYRGGSLVPNTAINAAIPTSGVINLSDFYGASADNLKSGLTSFYELAEAGATNSLSDTSGNGRDLPHVGSGGASAVSGKVGNARQWNYQAVFAAAYSTSTIISTTNYTMSGWYKLTNTTDLGRIIYLGQSAPDGLTAEVTIISNTGLRFGKCSGSAFGNPETVTTTGLGAGNWNFFLAWTDSTTGRINLQVNNGTVASAVLGTFATFNNGAQTPRYCIGGTWASSGYLGIDSSHPTSGIAIDQIGTWNRTLNFSERAALWNGGAGRAYSQF
jgi:hypothetical protein